MSRTHGLDGSQDYDPEVLASLNSWEHEVRVAPSKIKGRATSHCKLDRAVKYINGPAKTTNEPSNSNTGPKLQRHEPACLQFEHTARLNTIFSRD